MPHNLTAAPTIPVVLRGISHTFACAILTAAAADWLLYGHPAGISVALLLVITAVCVSIVNIAPLAGRTWLALAGILGACLLPIVENFGLLSLFWGVTGLCAYTLVVSGCAPVGIADGLRQGSRLIFTGPLRILVDLTRASALLRRSKTPLFGQGKMAAWMVPMGLGAVFLLLFSAANPLIEQWISGIDLAGTVDHIRILFWLTALALAWPFMRVRLGGKKRLPAEAATSLAEPALDEVAGQLLGADAVLYSLILFNALFAVQTALDIAYLWGGAALPKGMTYADYAHRGAYSLIVTALLAAAFVLFALRPGSAMERSPLLRGLVYLWIGQNVFLVMSAMLRLNLYVEAYSLTYWRVAAFIWMLLIATGLVLIVARIALRKSNAWLISCNVIVLAATLYICAFVNFPHLMTGYNIDRAYDHTHSRPVTRRALDQGYLCRLGPYTIPAITKAFTFTSDGVSWLSAPPQLERCMSNHIKRHRARMEDWRAWSFRGWRLMRYLDKQGRV